MGVYRGYGSGTSAADPTNSADNVTFDTTGTTIAAVTVQDAIAEVDDDVVALDARVDALEAAPAASGANYMAVGTLPFCNNILPAATYANGQTPPVGASCWLPYYNGWDSVIPNGSDLSAININNYHIYPASFAVDMDFSHITIRYGANYAGAAGTKGRVIIWEATSASNSAPGTIVADTGEITWGAGDWDELAFLATFAAEAGKLYWIGMITDGNGVQFRIHNTTTASVAMAYNIQTDNGGITRYTLAGTTGTSPGNSPVLTVRVQYDHNKNQPFFFHT